MEAPSGARSVRAIAVIWKPKWIGAALRQAAPEALEMEAEALRRGIGTPFRRLMARVPAWGMRIQFSPLDPSFPQLIRLSDPEYVRQLLESVSGPSRYLSARLSVNGSSSARIATVPVGDFPLTVNVDSAGQFVYVGTSGTTPVPGIYVVSAASNTMVRT